MRYKDRNIRKQKENYGKKLPFMVLLTFQHSSIILTINPHPFQYFPFTTERLVMQSVSGYFNFLHLKSICGITSDHP